ncbi:MAG: spore cortex biosynthesis protein YabQ [Oscillospiraceae bacterium]|nr:spore cortex biosynthesis protein YabQ [Oscillospiraceae bacterium]
MFEPVTQSLQETAMFAILGFALAALYEPLRIFRLFFNVGKARKNDAVIVGVQDFLFLSLSGLIVFAYSLEFGAGHFRYYYLVGLAFGGVVYFLTLGKLVNTVTRVFADAIRRLVRYVLRLLKRKVILPLREKIVQIAQKRRAKIAEMYKNAEKRRIDLQNTAHMRYNSIKAQRAQVRAERNSRLMPSDGGRKTDVEKAKRQVVRARITKV